MVPRQATPGDVALTVELLGCIKFTVRAQRREVQSSMVIILIVSADETFKSLSQIGLSWHIRRSMKSVLLRCSNLTSREAEKFTA